MNDASRIDDANREAAGSALAKAFNVLQNLLMVLACASIFAMMLIVAADVFLRYFFNSPIPWAYDVTAIYLIGAAFFFALPGTLARNGHIRIDLLVGRFGRKARRRSEIVWSVLSIAAFGAVLWLGAATTYSSWSAGEVIAGAINWPTWLSTIVVPVGTAVLILGLLLRIRGGADDE